jgi:hypothetical protein
MRPLISCPTILALLAFGSAANAQMVVATNTVTDSVVGFSPVDGSVVEPFVFAVRDYVQVSAIAVGLEVWVSEQIPDRITRYDHGGNVLGIIGPLFPGGRFDNIRGLTLIGSTVYVCNSEGDNGATANSLVLLDTSGNHLSTIPLSNSPSPYHVLPFQGDILVSSSSGGNDVHRYTTAGVSVGAFHNSSGLNFTYQLCLASDGNVWAAGFSNDVVVKLNAATGAIMSSFPAPDVRGVFELQNGNVLWTGQAGAHVYDVGTMTSTLVYAGSSQQLNVIPTGVSFNRKYGIGCHDVSQDHSNLFELFPTVAAADAALEGNALHFTMTGNGYVANWLPGVAGALYVPPTGGATIVANASSIAETFTPSVPIPVPGGTTVTWTVSSEGILTAGPMGNQEVASIASMGIIDTAEGLAFYTWTNQNPAEAGSGKIKWEEAAGVLYVTFDGVECATGTPTQSPSTYQYQINMATGDVTVVWVSMFGVGNTSSSDVIAGCTLAGTGFVPVSQPLSAAVAKLLEPDPSLLLQLSATPAPVINPSTVVTYAVDNIPETAPGSGLYLSLIFLSASPLPSGLDLAGIVTTVPGCSLYLGSLAIGIGTAVTVVPQNLVPFVFSTPVFAPGDVIGAQAVALFDPAFPLSNGEAGGFLLSNPVLTTTYLQ